MKRPLRFVLATPICDGHDVAVCAITRILRKEGAAPVYIGFNKTPFQIVKAAVEEGADAIAISTYNGGHMLFLKDVIKERNRRGIASMPIFCGGGGTILEFEVKPLEKAGVAKVYRPPLDLTEACRDMIKRAADFAGKKASAPIPKANGFLGLARRIGAAEANGRIGKTRKPGAIPRIWGIGGPGGAGKSTTVDELVFRFLERTTGKLAVISIDPTMGDRLRMLHCYSPRVYLRSISLGPGESLEKKLLPALNVIAEEDFKLILVESVGLGQNDLGVAPYVDASIYCMTPEYGTNVQLEKEALLNRASIVVMNKRDYPQAEAKSRRVRNYLRPEQAFILTEAKDHGDAGVSRLFELLCERSGIKLPPPDASKAMRPAPSYDLSRSAYMHQVIEGHGRYYEEMAGQIADAENNAVKAAEWRARFDALWALYGFDGNRDGAEEEGGVLYRKGPKGDRIPVARRTTCDLWVPVLGLPARDSSFAQIITYFYKQNLPGEFPYTEGAFTFRRADQDPIRMFAGLGLPETTNKRFHLLMRRGGAPRLSTAFDSLTLYGLDSDEPGALAKVGEGGVAVDTVDDMASLFKGFNLEEGSVSLTMSGPAPAVLALFFAAAKKRGFDLRKLRGTIQTDILKEVQAQNEAIFPLDPSLRLISDVIEWTGANAPSWYPISISGYHIHEAGANPVMELAFTLANGLTYCELFRRRGISPEDFTKRVSFFFTAGSEIEFHVMGRVARRIWAVAMDRIYGVKGAGRRLKFHSQTSGRSLQDVEPLHNLARVTVQAERALHNNTNSLHTNSYKETYSTPEEDDVILAMGCQQIPLLETGDFRYIENLHQGAYGLSYLEDEVERGVMKIFREIDAQGGVVPAIENEYFRGMIQEEVMREQQRRRTGEKLIVGVNYLNFGEGDRPRGSLVNIGLAEKKHQIARTGAFKKKHKEKADAALARLQAVARGDGNVFAELVRVMEVATVGQVTHALWDVWGRFRPSM